jgi:hypothetical protein
MEPPCEGAVSADEVIHRAVTNTPQRTLMIRRRIERGEDDNEVLLVGQTITGESNQVNPCLAIVWVDQDATVGCRVLCVEAGPKALAVPSAELLQAVECDELTKANLVTDR